MRSFRLFLFFFFLLSFFSFFSFIDGTIRNCPGCNFQGDDFQDVLSSMFFTLFFFFHSLACLSTILNIFWKDGLPLEYRDSNMKPT